MKKIQRVLRNNQLGFLQPWTFKNSFLFMNAETGETTELSGDDCEEIFEEEWEKLYDARNYPAEYFIHNGHNMVHNGKDDGLDKRQRTYGLIHDSMWSVILQSGTNGVWTCDFCREIAHLIASYYFALDLMERYGEDFKGKLGEGDMDLFKKHYLPYGSTYEKMCDRTGMIDGDIKITEEEIISYIKKFSILPITVQESLFPELNFGSSEEMIHFQSIALK